MYQRSPFRRRFLSTVIAEVMKGTGVARIVETTQPVQPKLDNSARERKREKNY
jgi:hypothetical protein